jgi:hypothetical protein
MASGPFWLEIARVIRTERRDSVAFFYGVGP